MSTSIKVLSVALAATFVGSAWASVSADEAGKLGQSLTAVGAEVAASKDGQIPAYEGGLTTPPAGFRKGSGMRPDPFANEKPRLVVTGKNAAQYQNKLTAGTLELLKRYPDFRVDVYPSHRTVVFPEFIQQNTIKNASDAKSTEGGLAIENALPGFPFPVPKSGYEAMWNHLMRYQGRGELVKYDAWNVDASGAPVLATTGQLNQEFPLFDPARKTPAKDSDIYFKVKVSYSAPARRAGEANMLIDAVNPLAQPRRAWTYLPGQRRVKLAPDLSYDTPNPGTAGSSTYDDVFLFNGAMDRYSFKLIGKKEMIVPYNDYKLAYHNSATDLLKPHFINPDLNRWELHRVWVVEATLKPGKRHIYSKRTFYLDEDSWVALASDEYDGRQQLYRSGFVHSAFSYDVRALNSDNQMFYDFAAGTYSINGVFGPYGGVKYVEPLPATQWSPEALAAGGVR